MTLRNPKQCTKRAAGWRSPIQVGRGVAMAIPCDECGGVHAAADPVIIHLCGEALCTNVATTHAIVRAGRGHVFELCDGCRKKLEDKTRAEGVLDRIEFQRIGS